MTAHDPAASVRSHFHDQANACDKLGSPFTARLCRALARVLDTETAVGARVLGWQGDAHADALPLRLCGGLHALVLSGADSTLSGIYPPHGADEERIAEVLPTVLARDDRQLLTALESAPQTNEIARAAMLLPGFLAIARETGLPLELAEIGSSAGLNLLFDAFGYRYGESVWGNGAFSVRLAPEVRGIEPPLGGNLRIVARGGCDVAPIYVANAPERLRLRSYVWADQAARLERLDAAIELAGKNPIALEKADAAEYVDRRLATRKPGAAFTLFHSIMWQYMPRTTRERIEEAMGKAGRTATLAAPLAWLRMEPLAPGAPYATLVLTSWPGGETRALARCDYHGRWIEWMTQP